jgi:hypothetical protein
VEWHHSIWKNDVERFGAFWVYRDVLEKTDKEQIIPSDKFEAKPGA